LQLQRELAMQARRSLRRFDRCEERQEEQEPAPSIASISTPSATRPGVQGRAVRTAGGDQDQWSDRDEAADIRGDPGSKYGSERGTHGRRGQRGGEHRGARRRGHTKHDQGDDVHRVTQANGVRREPADQQRRRERLDQVDEGVSPPTNGMAPEPV